MENKPAKICVPVRVSRASELREALARAAKVADIIELRLDYLDDGDLIEVTQHLSDYLRESDLPKILTFRSIDQGGNIAEIEQRRKFWLSLGQLPEDCLIDLELDLANEFAQNASPGSFDWRNVICSFHDFAGFPKNLETIYEQMAATPAHILKIAVQTTDATDCLPIFDLPGRAQSEGREIIAIAMGPAGVMTRILGPSRGSFLTYGSLGHESATAPGQVTARDLRQIYRIDQIDRDTEIFGIIGKPVGHSLSRQIHNAAFAAAKVNAVYLPFEVTDANEFLRRMVRPESRELDWNLRGLSVTAPHKSAVMDRLDWIDTAAKAIGAVNTIVIREGQMRGYNTDATAFILPLREKFGSLEKLPCAIVGAGGGARAAAWALREAGAKVTLFARDAAKAQIVAEDLGVDYQSLARADFENFKIVINATPLGTRGLTEDQTVATAEQLRSVRLAYDLVYNPLETRFLREARAAGAQTLSGIEMLIAQAIEQFKLWTGAQPDIGVMREAAMKALQSI
jgi:3-dehydroquinate dehydratase/shikimate dehydrogenase